MKFTETATNTVIDPTTLFPSTTELGSWVQVINGQAVQLFKKSDIAVTIPEEEARDIVRRHAEPGYIYSRDMTSIELTSPCLELTHDGWQQKRVSLASLMLLDQPLARIWLTRIYVRMDQYRLANEPGYLDGWIKDLQDLRVTLEKKREPKAPEPVAFEYDHANTETKVVDLMEALKKSLAPFAPKK